MKKDIKNSNIMKGICYCLVPILVLIILLNTFSLIYYEENQEYFTEYITYAGTDELAYDFYRNITRAISIVENEKNIIDAKKEMDINDTNGITLQNNFSTIKDYDVLFIGKDGTIITNIQKTNNTNTQEKLKQYVMNKYFWVYDGNKIQTNVKGLEDGQFTYNELKEIQNLEYEVYISYKDAGASNEFYAFYLIYNFVRATYENSLCVIMISIMFLIVSCIYIILSIGHKSEEKEIYTNWLDEIPYEIVTSVTILVGTLSVIALIISFSYINNLTGSARVINANILLSLFVGIIIYALIAIFGVTTIRRIKAKVFLKNTIIYKLIKWLQRSVTDIILKNLDFTVKIIVIFMLQVVLILLARKHLIFILLLLALWYVIFKKILQQRNFFCKIRDKIKDMYNGEVTNKLNEEEFKDEQKEIAKELNDISGGLSNAIEEAMKSERLKTELITNVSHDIKTPLTSIINYVDLMKKENIENEKIKEYLEVLDSKSQRLKKLTEDLVEASKASSGNIKLTMEKLNVKELIRQIGGEFEDKFKKKGLEIIESYPEDDVYIQADSRYMYRIMENMYVNISKYALENSRVYVDVAKKLDKVQITIKNISKDKLNITVDELMQRFVRGDSSRTTEGSGLGISIAKSLTELQQGSFNIYLDGDLFKVVIEFKLK